LSSIQYDHDLLINLLASVTAGAIANTIIAPMWTIRTRMMTQSNHADYRNAYDAFLKIYRKEGLHALYRGVIPSMLGLVRGSDFFHQPI
jgi:solute carrier family 25 folate transporter 32